MIPVSIDAKTSLYCVLGNPVAHSLSPVMHNRAFARTGGNSAYVAFRVEDPAGAAAGIRALGIRGASVTIPHKVAIMDHLDEIDDLARSIGAVNTVDNRDGRLIGYNTDGMGAADALAEAVDISGRRIALIGAGGAARAIGFTLAARGAEVLVFNRTRTNGEALAKDLSTRYAPLDQLDRYDCQVVINTTSVGMAPDTDAMPIRAEHLDPAMVVMDIVYNPRLTRLLETARGLGCQTMDGVAMFVNQGAAQFELWTGQTAPRAVMQDAVTEALTRNEP